MPPILCCFEDFVPASGRSLLTLEKGGGKAVSHNGAVPMPRREEFV